MRKLIRKLSDMRGISGFEYRLTDQIADMFKKYCDDVKIDSLGSVIAVKRSNKPNAPKLMIEAHCDEIGLIVTSITDEGYLTFANVGGVDERTLPSTEVTVHGKEDLWGVIGIKPNYLLEQGKTAKLKELAVDTGLSAEKVKELVAVGDSITLAQSVGRLGKKQFSGKSLDDRASVAAIMRVMKNIKDLDIDIDVYAVAAVQEEVGCRGGKTTAYGINPDMAVAIDVCHGITPDNSDNAFEVGTGTVLSVGPNLHPKLTDELFAVSKRHGIKVSTDVDGGNTGTDAWEIQVACDGVPTALISIPLKYMHTSVETLAVSDVKATVNLLTEFIKEIRRCFRGLFIFLIKPADDLAGTPYQTAHDLCVKQIPINDTILLQDPVFHRIIHHFRQKIRQPFDRLFFCLFYLFPESIGIIFYLEQLQQPICRINFILCRYQTCQKSILHQFTDFILNHCPDCLPFL